MDLGPFACWECGFSSHRSSGSLSLVSVVFRQVEVPASGRSLVRTSPADCGVSECDLQSLKMRRPWPTRAVVPWQKKKKLQFVSAQDVHILINVTSSEKLNFRRY